ncbi:cytochrome c oxidase subunit II [Brevirhabdus sp.]|uniref:cytochrome c oxidase subunit II n=1 Tax=Brevirhabdus sp. TaxID=2004514 RepID=UPI004059E4EB
MTSRTYLRYPAALTLLAVAGCDGPQSVLAPAGREAGEMASLFWVMLGGAVLLWLLVNGLFLYVTRINPRKMSRGWAEALIIGGGIVFPLVVITSLLGYGLSSMPQQRLPGDGLVIKIRGEEWWWRVEYWPEGADKPIVAANELRLPAGQRTEIKLTANKVIHSFWVPAIAGKMDLIPGRENRLSVLPEKTGVFRGQCAEFCGLSHALMAFRAVVLSPDDFDSWLRAEAAPARPPAGGAPARGRDLFLSQGCGACHTVRGTPAAGRSGPDLTHVGSRLSLAAGTLAPTTENLVNWIRQPGAIKPGAKMPAYDDLPRADLAALAAYLKALE